MLKFFINSIPQEKQKIMKINIKLHKPQINKTQYAIK